MKNLIYYLVEPLLQFIKITIMKTLILILLFGLVASYSLIFANNVPSIKFDINT